MNKMHSLSRDLSILLVAIINLKGVHSFVSPSLLATTKKEATVLPEDPKSRLFYKTSSSPTTPPLTTVTEMMPPTPNAKTLPKIIQGGMGVRISSWNLAREVSKKGELGVISGTAMDNIFVRTLQDGKSYFED